LDRLTSTDEVMDGMERVLGGFGFRNLIMTGVPGPNQRLKDVLLAERCVGEWLKIYTERQYVHHDPLVRLVKCAARPFDWSELPYDQIRDLRASEVMRERNELGLRRGLVVPILDVSGSVFFVSMTGRKPELTGHTKPVIQLIAVCAFYRVCGLRNPVRRKKPVLTAREREVLTWAANGKTAWEIGEILAIAKRTVDEHARTAFRKLGAVNRTQAVAIALRDRLIDL
jgi:LuxR family quorum sensing-dependent transcriptional regulator